MKKNVIGVQSLHGVMAFGFDIIYHYLRVAESRLMNQELFLRVEYMLAVMFECL